MTTPEAPARPPARALALTGLGMVTPFGAGRAAFFAGLAARRVPLGELTRFAAPADCPCEHAGEINDYDWNRYLRTRQTYADRVTQLAIGAARLAMDDAGRRPPAEVAESTESSGPEGKAGAGGFSGQVGICMGTRFGCVETEAKFFDPLAAKTPKLASALLFSHSAPNAAAAFCAVELGLRGHSAMFSGDSDSGRRAMVSAARAVERGVSGAVLAGGADALSDLVYRHAAGVGALPDTRSLPPPAVFPAGDGPDAPDAAATRQWRAIPAESAVFALIEDGEAARRRQAPLLGFWEGSEALIDAFDTAAENCAHPWIFGDAGAALPWLRALAGGFASGGPAGI